MPDNSTKYGDIPEEKQKEMIYNADKRIEDIAKIVNGKEEHFDNNNTSLFKTYIHPGIDCRFAYSSIKEQDKKYTTDEKCNGCSTCQKVCPVNNITMKDNKPVWNNHCQLCAACMNWCPTESIQWGKMTIGIKRYHNPNINVKDIFSSSA